MTSTTRDIVIPLSSSALIERLGTRRVASSVRSSAKDRRLVIRPSASRPAHFESMYSRAQGTSAHQPGRPDFFSRNHSPAIYKAASTAPT